MDSFPAGHCDWDPGPSHCNVAVLLQPELGVRRVFRRMLKTAAF